jgi:hypothetical protein
MCMRLAHMKDLNVPTAMSLCEALAQPGEADLEFDPPRVADGIFKAERRPVTDTELVKGIRSQGPIVEGVGRNVFPDCDIGPLGHRIVREAREDFGVD